MGDLEDTPMAENEQEGCNNAMTPMVCFTPGYNFAGGATGATSGAMTPGMQTDIAFSPNIMRQDGFNNYASPGIGSPSPAYGSANYGSPAYGTTARVGSN